MSTPPADPPFERALLEALPRIRGYVAALAAGGPGAQDADDLLQDVAAKALRYRHAYDEGRALVPWLRRTALHVVLDARRAAARRPAGLEPDAEPVAPSEPSPAESGDELAGLLDRLDPLPREILLRFHRDGWSVARIAASHGLPEGTVKSHLHRARRRLRELPGAPTS